MDRAKIAVAEMQRYRETYGGERLQFNTVKLFMDGIHENRSGALLEPYADDPDYVSDTTLSIEELKDFLDGQGKNSRRRDAAVPRDLWR